MQRQGLFPTAAVLAAALTACADTPADRLGPDTADRPAAAVASAAVALVTTTADAGPGSLRAAIEEANAQTSVGVVRFASGLGPIALTSPVVYTGRQALTLDGRNAVIQGPACDGCSGLVANGGADLTFQRLTVRQAAGNGITVIVPADATGEVTVRLREVTVAGNGLHGILIDDQQPADAELPGGFDSEAGVGLIVEESTIERNGFQGASDFDGIRVNEGGLGSIEARIHGSRIVENGADGVELDERGAGDVALDLRHSHLDRNGPRDPEDLDDGLDIDEAGAGDIRATLVGVTAHGNFDEGLDLNEGGLGNLSATFTQVDASGNIDEGIAFEELDDGRIDVAFHQVTASNTADADGIQFEEFGPGDLMARVVHSVANDNDGAGIKAEQNDGGMGLLHLQRVTLDGNEDGPVEADGVELREVAPTT